MNNNTEQISRYLQNEMSGEENIFFEKQLFADKELQQEFSIQQQIIKAAENAGLKSEFSKAVRKKVFNHRLLQWGIVAAILTTAFVFYAIKTNLFSGHAHTEKVKSVTTEQFVISNIADTIIETKNGVVFAIPANAFNSEGKNIRLEIKTALNPYDIIRQGLSTTSNGSLLQTAGMFYINGYDGDQPVSLIKTIDVSVPAKEINPAMQLFDGVEDSSGHINWVNPKPMEHRLRTYDITTLDFYPSNYIPTLRALQKDYTNKKYTDSLYYSFSQIPVQDVAAGKTLFMLQCASCHSIFKDMTGPALQHLEERGKWSDHNEILKWLHNPGSYMENDPYTRGLKTKYRSIELAFSGLTIKNIDNVVAYINDEVKKKKSGGGGNERDYQKKDTSRKDFAKDSIGLAEGLGMADTNTIMYELDPARIRTIWDLKFNNTILATKEFEERLHYIHSLCTAEYFNLYITNFKRPMFEIDQLCANRSSGEVRKKFLEFAARKDGGVMINEGMQEKLSYYFQTKYKAYQQAAAETWDKYKAELARLNAIADEKQKKEAISDFTRSSSNYEEEFCANLSEAYRQVGVTYRCNDTIVPSPPANNYYKVTISTPGWKNLDVFVKQVTANRQTGTYTDSATGKTVKLTYKEVNISIENLADYDKVFVYLLPDDLRSFQRVEQKGIIFKEGLNSLFKYDAVAIAYKGTEIFLYQQRSIQPGQYDFALSLILENEVKEILKNYSGAKSEELNTELEYRIFEQQETIRQFQLRKDLQFREQVAASIFHCGFEGEPIINIIPPASSK